LIPLQQQSNISSFWCLSLLLLTINLAWHNISKLQICLCSWFTWWFKTLTWNEVVPRIIVHYWYSRCQQIYMPSLNGTIKTEITVQHKMFLFNYLPVICSPYSFAASKLSCNTSYHALQIQRGRNWRNISTVFREETKTTGNTLFTQQACQVET